MDEAEASVVPAGRCGTTRVIGASLQNLRGAPPRVHKSRRCRKSHVKISCSRVALATILAGSDSGTPGLHALYAGAATAVAALGMYRVLKPRVARLDTRHQRGAA